MSPTGFENSSTEEENSTLSEVEISTMSTEPARTNAASTSLVYLFEAMCILAGIAGIILNGMVLKVLLTKELRKQKNMLLLINQVFVDLLASIVLVITYTVQTANVSLDGSWGYQICVLFFKNGMIRFFLDTSNTNLELIAIERYLKIVHHAFFTKYIKTWMAYGGIVYIWLINAIASIDDWYIITVVGEQQCVLRYLHSQLDTFFITFVNLMWQYFIPILIFVFCYGSIARFVRKKNQVMESHLNPGTGGNVHTAAQRRSEMNLIETMITISVAYFFAWIPRECFSILVFLRYPLNYTFVSVGYFFVFLNVIMNPFIYAVKHKAVKKGLRKWLCKRAEKTEITTVGIRALPSPTIRVTGVNGNRKKFWQLTEIS